MEGVFDKMKGVPGTENIAWIESEKKFIVSKRINGYQKFLGSHKSLICALMIRDYCKAHNWIKYPKSLNKTGEHHIIQINKNPMKKYTVYKIIDGHHVTFGSYPTLKEAIEKRDYCIAHDWSLDLIQKNPLRFIDFLIRKDGKIKYNIYHKENGSTVNYGLFDTLHEAMYERDLLEACNWDSDVICETLDERINGQTIYLNRVMV